MMMRVAEGASLNDDFAERAMLSPDRSSSSDIDVSSLVVQAAKHDRPKREQIDMDAHEGLRGVCALWVMEFHCILYSKSGLISTLDFQGSSIMPVFFLLSAYTLTIFYNNIDLSTTATFIKNRLARVLPSYYLFNALAVPLWFYGYQGSSIDACIFSAVTTITNTSTLLCFALGSSLDGPAWTVQTLLWLWMVFPFVMPSIRKQTTAGLSSLVLVLYWIQAIVLAVIFVALLIVGFGFWISFAASTMNPLSRFPLFMIGMCAGEIVLRCKRNSEAVSKYLTFGFGPVNLFPYNHTCCEGCARGADDDMTTIRRLTPDQLQQEEQLWARRTDLNAASLLLLTLAVFAAGAGAGTNTLGAVWLQAAVPYMQLTVIVGLCCDGGRSLSYRALTTALARFLGRISMTVYLIHYPVIFYLCWAANSGKRVLYPESLDCSSSYSNTTSPAYTACAAGLEAYKEALAMPDWGIVGVPAITVPLSIAAFYLFEEPVRRYFNPK